MASDHYTPVKPAANAQGQTADADDVNSVSNATETAFESLEAEVDQISAQGSQWADKAQEWAENPEDTNITGEPAGSYSAKHYSIKAQDSETAASASASAASTSENNASASATNASNSETSAQTAQTAAEAAQAAAEAAASQTTHHIVVPNTQSDSYTLVLADRGKGIRMNKATAQTLTIPPDVFVDNVMIPVIQTGAGACTLVAGSGVTLNTPDGFTLVIDGAGAGVTLWCIDPDTNTWDVTGQLVAS
jgi:hypothetical protein